MSKGRLAIIGTGIAGLGAAHLLKDCYQLSIFEKNDYIGGHGNTLMVLENKAQINSGNPISEGRADTRQVFIDSGFMVMNAQTYPQLNKLFAELQVPLKETSMSFSVQNRDSGIEWCGSGLNELFGQRKNMMRPRFWKFVLELDRFNKVAERDLNSQYFDSMTIEEYAAYNKFSQDLLNHYLLPMGASIWSTPPDKMLSFPAATLLRFFHNHRFNNGLKDHLSWQTIEGGARVYIAKLSEPFADCIRLNTKVEKLSKLKDGVVLNFSNGPAEHFDAVILAGHADESLRILGEPNDLERELLGSFSYQKNIAILHTDVGVMPENRRCWASWNFRLDKSSSRSAEKGKFASSVHYYMNRLQSLPTEIDYFVSLNATDLIDRNKIIKEITYHHPVFSVNSAKAQKRLADINNQEAEQRVFFCGSYFRYGFHEDAYLSAQNLALRLRDEKTTQILSLQTGS